MEKYNDIKLSPIIIGAMRLGEWGAKFDTAKMQAFIEGCIDLKMTSFDHADIYGSYTTESDFGKVFQQVPSLRDKVELITKCGIRFISENRPNNRIKSYDSSGPYIQTSVENSLRNFNTDYIDLLLIHRPDFLMQPDEIAKTIEQLHQSGKVRAFGVSNFTITQFEILNDKIPLYANQIEISLTKLQAFHDSTLDQCIKHGVRPMAWSPFEGGKVLQTTRIQQVAMPLLTKYDLTLDQLMLAWLLRHPAKILPILGTSKLSRVAAAVEALNIEIEREDWYDLLQASRGHEVA